MDRSTVLTIRGSRSVVTLITMAAFGTMLFVIGLATLSIGDFSKVPQWNSETLVLAVSIAICLLLSYGIIGGIKRLQGRKPAITLNSKGLVDNSSLWSMGFIPWSDIVKFSVDSKFRGSSCVFVHVKNPEYYIAKGGFLERMASRSTFNKYGTPVWISLIYLDFSPHELLSALKTFYKRHVTVEEKDSNDYS
jgi:hypothetical protein